MVDPIVNSSSLHLSDLHAEGGKCERSGREGKNIKPLSRTTLDKLQDLLSKAKGRQNQKIIPRYTNNESSRFIKASRFIFWKE